MKHVEFTAFLVGLLLFLNFGNLNAQEQKSGKDLIQMSIGEANKWTNTRYLLYSVVGPSNNSGMGNERSFLIDKKTGDCRFEGTNKNNESLVLLFNYKTKKVKRYFVNTEESKENPNSIMDNILGQFFKDTQILFLPAFLSDSPSSITDVSQKVINTDKLNVISFTNMPTLGHDNVNGKITLTNKGDIKSISVGNIEYKTSAIKDIGEGILLPTVFENHSSYRFQIVAAFTDVETGKFTNI